jgi:hypothetical protein
MQFLIVLVLALAVALALRYAARELGFLGVSSFADRARRWLIELLIWFVLGGAFVLLYLLLVHRG